MLALYRRLNYWGILVKNSFNNIVLRTIHKLPPVKYLVYEVTDACNSRCKHCYIWKNTPTKDILTPSEIEELLSDDFFSNLKVILLTGGEPILRDDIRELIASIHRARPHAGISLSTNGLLPQRVLEVVNYTIANDIPINIGISLDGIGEDHDVIRGVKGNFEKTNYLLKELIKLKEQNKNKMGAILIGHTLSNLTVDTLKKVQAYAQQLKVGFLAQLYEEFIYYHNINKNPSNNLRDYRHSDNWELINEIKKLTPSFHNEMLLHALTHKLRFGCAALRTFFLLRCNGDVAPCLYYSNVIAGNIKSHSSEEVWHSESAGTARKSVEDCQGCSNSWATDWSFEAWFPSFLKIKINLAVKNLLHNLKEQN